MNTRNLTCTVCMMFILILFIACRSLAAPSPSVATFASKNPSTLTVSVPAMRPVGVAIVAATSAPTSAPAGTPAATSVPTASTTAIAMPTETPIPTVMPATTEPVSSKFTVEYMDTCTPGSCKSIDCPTKDEIIEGWVCLEYNIKVDDRSALTRFRVPPQLSGKDLRFTFKEIDPKNAGFVLEPSQEYQTLNYFNLQVQDLKSGDAINEFVPPLFVDMLVGDQEFEALGCQPDQHSQCLRQMGLFSEAGEDRQLASMTFYYPAQANEVDSKAFWLLGSINLLNPNDALGGVKHKLPRQLNR